MSPAAEYTTVSRAVEAEDLTVDSLSSPAGPIRLHQLTLDSLDQLTAKLEALRADDADMILALPARSAVVLGEPEELLKTARIVGGICVAASSVPLASQPLADQLARAIAQAEGNPVVRSHCFPHALVAPAAQLRSLLADLPEGGSDADRITAAVLANRHEIVLDIVSFFFHVLDGTGTDVTIVAGRAHVGGKRPLVLIDPEPNGDALATAEIDLSDHGTEDLAHLLRYDGAAAAGDEVTVAAPDVRVTPLWSPSFCTTVIKAAEVAGLWTNDIDHDSTGREAVSLLDLIPTLLAHLDADLAHRICARLGDWESLAEMTLSEAVITRQRAGGPVMSTVATHRVGHVLGSVRLNDAYMGGALLLPDVGWDDSAVPVGALTLWPSRPDHPHQMAPIARGVKYTLSLRWGPSPIAENDAATHRHIAAG